MGECKQLRRWIRGEQILLWGRLDSDLRSALNGSWSMGSQSTVARIISAARLVGPTPYTQVQWRLLAGNVYTAVLFIGNVRHSLPDAEKMTRLSTQMIEYGTVERHQAELAGTVAKLRDLRTVAEILEDVG